MTAKTCAPAALASCAGCFFEPVCPVVGCVGSALCEVLRADEELCLLSE
jgi:hypothetical protein